MVTADPDAQGRVVLAHGSTGLESNAALLAAVVLRLRDGVYRRIHAAENVDADRDGIPDVYAADVDR